MLKRFFDWLFSEDPGHCVDCGRASTERRCPDCLENRIW